MMLSRRASVLLWLGIDGFGDSSTPYTCGWPYVMNLFWTSVNANSIFAAARRNSRISLRPRLPAQIVRNSRQAESRLESARAEGGYSKGGVPWENLSLRLEWRG